MTLQSNRTATTSNRTTTADFLLHPQREKIRFRCARFVSQAHWNAIGNVALGGREISISMCQEAFDRNDCLHEGDGMYRQQKAVAC